MRELSRKSVLLFVAAMALCAFVMPSLASAGTWDPAGPHTLTGPALSMAIPAVGGGWVCHGAFVVDANGTSQLTVTSATFSACSGTGTASGCDIDVVQGVGPERVVDGADTSAIQVTNVNYDLIYTSSGSCAFSGVVLNVSGTLTTGGFNNSTSSLSLTGSTGLQGSIAGTSLGPVTVDGGLTDRAGTLTLS